MHGIFTRHGGVSPEPWKTLNVGLTVGDDSRRVIENRERIFNTFDLDNKSIFDVWQVHSNKVIHAYSNKYQQSELDKADAIGGQPAGHLDRVLDGPGTDAVDHKVKVGADALA